MLLYTHLYLYVNYVYCKFIVDLNSFWSQIATNTVSDSKNLIQS